MIVTFPHMGNMHIVLNALFTSFGCKVLPAPPISKRTMELGVKYSPETVCLPFKVTLGNFIEALEQGADTIVTCGGVGPCRLGYYAEVQKGILQELGYKFDMIAIEPDIIDVYKNLRKVAPRKSWQEIYHAFKYAGAKMNILDNVERRVLKLRAHEKKSGTVDAIWKQTVEAVDAAENITGVLAAGEQASRKLDEVELKPGFTPLRIGVVGEIYVMLEPFVNLDLERILGSMGVEVEKTMYLSDYVRGHLLKKREYLEAFNRLFDLARPYLGHYVGGHGLKSIGRTVDMGRAGYDGIVQVFPFTCMPEIIAKNILPKVSKDVDIPVLSLAFDEQSGEAGVMTRLEAFIDLLKYREKNAGRIVI